MTISSTNRKAGPYAGNDVATAFPFSFKVFSNSDLYVVRADSTGAETTLVLTTDYTVALNTDQNANPGGTITLPVALATGGTLTIASQMQYLQPTDLTNQGGFYPKVITNALDRLTIFVQQLSESVSRSLKTAISTPPGVNATLPAPSPYALIGWNGDGTGFANSDTTGTTAIAADLSSTKTGKGSSLIGFIQSGAGAVGRTTQDKLREVVSVKDFGAFGDGITDDTAAIALAVTAAAGKTLYFPAGTYLVSAAKAAAAIMLPVGGITVRGAGKYTTTIKATVDCVLMAAVDASKVDISDIGFNGDRTTTGLAWQRAILLRGVVDISIRNCYFNGVGDSSIALSKQGFGGSDAVPDGTRQCERAFIQDNEFVDCFGTTSVITKYVGSKQTIITGNIFRNSSPTGISVESEGSLSTEFAEQIVVANNVIYKANYANTATAVTQAAGIGISERARYVVVSNNTIVEVLGNLGAKAIEIGTSPTQSDTEVSHIIVTGNVIENVTAISGNPHGILLLVGDSSAIDVVVANNVIDTCTSSGVCITTAYGTKTLGSIKNLAITGNVISNVAKGLFFDTLTSNGDVPLDGCTITGNVIKTVQDGIYLYVINSTIGNNSVDTGSARGISMLANSHNNVVSGNSIKKCVDGIYFASGDHLLINGNSCMNNSGYGIRIDGGSYAVITNNNCSDNQAVKTQQYGIRAPNGSTIRNNQLISNVAGTVWGGIANHNTGTYDAGLNRTA